MSAGIDLNGCVDLNFCGIKLSQTADFHIFRIFCRLTLLYIAYTYTLYTCIEFTRRTVRVQGSNDAISGHSVHPIVRAQAPLHLALVVHTIPGSSLGLHAYWPLVKVLSIV